LVAIQKEMVAMEILLIQSSAFLFDKGLAVLIFQIREQINIKVTLVK